MYKTCTRRASKCGIYKETKNVYSAQAVLTNPSKVHLTSPDGRTGSLVAGWHRPVDVDENTRVRRAVCTGERDQWAGCTASTICHCDLSASNVELGAAGRRGGVQADVLAANEVVAAGGALWDGEVDNSGPCVYQSVQCVWMKVD
jgi:hypothetical protein